MMSSPKYIPVSLLNRWPTLWTAPGLAVLLNTHPDGIEADIAVKAIAEARTAPRSFEAAFTELLAQGEFRAAEMILKLAQDRAEPILAREYLKKLEEARRIAELEAEARRIELAVRAARVVLSFPALTELQQLASCRKIEAESLAAEIEAQIAAREATLKKNPDTQQQDGLHGAPKNRVEQKVSEQNPYLIPRRPLFSLKDSLSTAIHHLLAETDSGIYSEWKPPMQDARGRRLLEALAQLIKRPPGNKEAVLSFASSLEDAMAGAVTPAPKFQRYKSGSCVYLTELCERYVPRLAACPDQRLPLWIPDATDTLPPEEITNVPLVLAFHPTSPPANADFIVSFDGELLCQLAGDPNRRVNFFRYVGDKIPTNAIFPAGFSSAIWPQDEIECIASWVFNLHNFPMASDETLHLIRYFTSGHRGLVAALLETVVAATDSRSEPITPAHIRRAWAAPSFRASAGRIIEQSLGSDPLVRATMFCTYFFVPNGEEIQADEIEQLLRDEFTYAGEIGDAIDRLVEAELLKRGSRPRNLQVPGPALVVLAQETFGGGFDRLIEISLSGINGPPSGFETAE